MEKAPARRPAKPARRTYLGARHTEDQRDIGHQAVAHSEDRRPGRSPLDIAVTMLRSGVRSGSLARSRRRLAVTGVSCAQRLRRGARCWGTGRGDRLPLARPDQPPHRTNATARRLNRQCAVIPAPRRPVSFAV
jgi:hypothetical protein